MIISWIYFYFVSLEQVTYHEAARCSAYCLRMRLADS